MGARANKAPGWSLPVGSLQGRQAVASRPQAAHCGTRRALPSSTQLRRQALALSMQDGSVRDEGSVGKLCRHRLQRAVPAHRPTPSKQSQRTLPRCSPDLPRRSPRWRSTGRWPRARTPSTGTSVGDPSPPSSRQLWPREPRPLAGRVLIGKRADWCLAWNDVMSPCAC